MKTLLKTEFYKLKREPFLKFLLLLTLFPVITGGTGAIFNDSTRTVGDLFFFINNQFSIFFPVVLFILIGSLFYQEYKNKTYINWITYGYPKSKLFLSKILVSIIIGVIYAVIMLLLFSALILTLQMMDKVSLNVSLLSISIGFLLESIIIVLVTTCAGAIVINLSRNIIISSVIGVIYGFLSAFFIGSENGYVVPGGFAYRVSMYFADESTYYELAKQATIGGVLSAILVLLILFIIGVLLFSKRRKIES
ncbi:ABC transporter permease [Clostridioides difficile]|uniref:ABC transporter permease n=1 Tax=Clostridioides difficile TaxID=1496 RepID=UPI000D1F1072|nr:ABC transporter permease [Clostridioides difficile]